MHKLKSLGQSFLAEYVLLYKINFVCLFFTDDVCIYNFIDIVWKLLNLYTAYPSPEIHLELV